MVDAKAEAKAAELDAQEELDTPPEPVKAREEGSDVGKQVLEELRDFETAMGYEPGKGRKVEEPPPSNQSVNDPGPTHSAEDCLLGPYCPFHG